MKRHVQYQGIRKWSGDDLLELQSEPLRVLDNFFAQWGNCVICGCVPSDNAISAGLVSIGGLTLPLAASAVASWPIYLVAAETHIQRDYADDVVRDIAVSRYAKIQTSQPSGSVSFLTIERNGNHGFLENMHAAWLTTLLQNVVTLQGDSSRHNGQISTLQEADTAKGRRITALEDVRTVEIDHVPTQYDDNYAIGQEVWHLGANGKTFYRCYDNSPGFAVWHESENSVNSDTLALYQRTPTLMHLKYLPEISTKNKVQQYLAGVLLPVSCTKGIIRQRNEGDSLKVHPTTGKLTLQHTGTTSFYVYATGNTELTEEVQITVRTPRFLKVNGVIMKANGKPIIV